MKRRDFLKYMILSSIIFNTKTTLADNVLTIREPLTNQNADTDYFNYASIGQYIPEDIPLTQDINGTKTLIYYPRLKYDDNYKPGIIIFSHDVLLDPTSYKNLLKHWVSHGYIVIAPIHNDSFIENGLTFRNVVIDGVTKWEIPELLENMNSWKERTLICSSILDQISIIETIIGFSIDTRRPVIAGHGFGSFVANCLLGAKIYTNEQETISFKDNRFFSGIIMSPQGIGSMGYKQDSWKDIKSPLLVMIAENDTGYNNQTAKERGATYSLSEEGYKHLIYLQKGTISNFTLETSSDQTSKIYNESIKAISICFLDSYSKYDENAFKNMNNRFFERNSLNTIKEFSR